MAKKEIIEGSLAAEVRKSDIEDAKHKAQVISEFTQILMEAGLNSELIDDIVLNEFYPPTISGEYFEY